MIYDYNSQISTLYIDQSSSSILISFFFFFDKPFFISIFISKPKHLHLYPKPGYLHRLMRLASLGFRNPKHMQCFLQLVDVQNLCKYICGIELCRYPQYVNLCLTNQISSKMQLNSHMLHPFIKCSIV